MYKADRLYDEMMALDREVKEMKIKNEEDMAKYFAAYTKLIYNYKWLGSIYDIYADDAKLYRENGLFFGSAHEIVQETLRLTAAFPDLQVELRDCFAVKKAEDEYKVWRYFTMEGTNKNASIYGRPTEKKLNANECISMSMATVNLIGGRWQIVRDFTMYSLDSIKAACTEGE